MFSKHSMSCMFRWVLMGALFGGHAIGVHAQQGSAPDKTIKLIVPFPAGGPTDTASRIVGQRLSERLKQTVVVENRAGASGAIAAAQVAKSAPDGNTLMMLATPTMLAPHFNKAAGYDTIKDFTPVATVYDLPIVIVVNTTLLPDVTDLAKLIAHAKAQPKPMNYTSSGVGSFGHLSMELLQQLAGFEMQHVPYKGGVPAITDTIGGVVPVMYSDLVAALPHIKSGKLRPLAVTSAKRSSSMPDVPTVSESGFKDFDVSTWYGVLAPAGTPAHVVATLNAEVNKLLGSHEVRDAIHAQGAEPEAMTQAKFANLLKVDYAKWKGIVESSGAKID